MHNLSEILNPYLARLSSTQKKTFTNNVDHANPFNEFEYTIVHLISWGVMTLEEYYRIRESYVGVNKYLPLFDLTPRIFGERWGQEHLLGLCPNLTKPSTSLDPKYSGQYDLVLNNIKIEVKASRAVDAKLKGALNSKALSSASTRPFDMNFQQIKPDCCDVFVWIAVWSDVIRYWVLNTREVSTNKYYNDKQHRGNEGEGQLHLKDTNFKEFTQFLCGPTNLEQAIQEAYRRLNPR